MQRVSGTAAPVKASGTIRNHRMHCFHFVHAAKLGDNWMLAKELVKRCNVQVASCAFCLGGLALQAANEQLLSLKTAPSALESDEDQNVFRILMTFQHQRKQSKR